MSPFMRPDAEGIQHVNIIRIVEQLIGAGISALIILYGGYVLLGERVDAATETMKQHIIADNIDSKEFRELMQAQQAMTIRHETVLRQEGLLK